MTTIRNIDSYLSDVAPRLLSEPWDNDGIMLCGNTGKEVKKALICLEVNTDAVRKAAKIGAELIITHHPFIFRPLKNVCGEAFSEIELLVKNDISVLSYHTRFDKTEGGVNDALAEVLGLSEISACGEFLRVGALPWEMTGEEFAGYIREKLHCGTMKAYFDKNAKIKTVAVCGGAGKDFLEEAARNADAYVSADFAHNTFIDAKNLGIAIFDAGHYHTENPAIFRFKELLEKKFPDLIFETFDVGSPFFAV